MAKELLGPDCGCCDVGMVCHCECHNAGTGAVPDVKVDHCAPCCETMACGAHIHFGFKDQHIAMCPHCSLELPGKTSESVLEGIDPRVQPRRIKL